MLKLHEGRYSKVSFLVLFVIIWVLMFVLIYILPYLFPGTAQNSDYLIQEIIFSAMIAFLIALCCIFARGGTRDPKELTDGITVVGI